MRTCYVLGSIPTNGPQVVATLYRDYTPDRPIAAIFDPAAVRHLTAAPRMAQALRRALATLRDPETTTLDVHLCVAIIEGALTEAGEMPAGAAS